MCIRDRFEGITADTGTTTASAPTDVLTVAGGTNITTSITGDTLTIDMSGALGDANQNAYGVIGSDSGSKTASSATATINVIGGTSISTAVSGDNLTVTNDAPNIVQEVYKTVTGDSGAIPFGTLTVCFSTKEISATVGIFLRDEIWSAKYVDPYSRSSDS